MPALRDDIDPDGLLEYSVVFTDRSLNSMSAAFVSVMQDISAMMKEVYQAHSLAVVPGGGTYGMEAIARQFADQADCLVIRNGWFSYRWSQIFEACGMVNSVEILAARQIAEDPQAPFAPVPIEEAEAKIAELKPGVVFCPHVETSAGLMLPRRLSAPAGRGGVSGGRSAGAGLCGLRHGVCGYAKDRCGCAVIRSAKGLDFLSLCSAGDARNAPARRLKPLRAKALPMI